MKRLVETGAITRLPEGHREKEKNCRQSSVVQLQRTTTKHRAREARKKNRLAQVKPGVLSLGLLYFAGVRATEFLTTFVTFHSFINRTDIYTNIGHVQVGIDCAKKKSAEMNLSHSSFASVELVLRRVVQ